MWTFLASQSATTSTSGIFTPKCKNISIWRKISRLISIKRRAEPDEESLLEVFRIFDPHDTGTIEEEAFRKIMQDKQGVTDEDIEEMIEGESEQNLQYWK